MVCEVAERKAGFSQGLVLEGRGTECLGSIPGKEADGRAKSSWGWSPNWYVGTKGWAEMDSLWGFEAGSHPHISAAATIKGFYF